MKCAMCLCNATFKPFRLRLDHRSDLIEDSGLSPSRYDWFLRILKPHFIEPQRRPHLRLSTIFSFLQPSRLEIYKAALHLGVQGEGKI